MTNILILFGLVIAGFVFGTIAEKRHYRRIQERETRFLGMPAVALRKIPPSDRPVLRTRMVSGNAVISIDYFKRFLAGLRLIFGGRLKSYESLLDRARREATLRMKESARDADMIICTRMETATVGKGAHKKQVGCVEALVYGTAVWLAPEE